LKYDISAAQIWHAARATGRARPYSDLDLTIDAGRWLTLDETARLAEAFSESDLPFRVDLVDWHDIDDRWRETIAAEGAADKPCRKRLRSAGIRSPPMEPSTDYNHAAGFSCTSMPIA
jgi:predicted nucleotidyltransferase